MSEPSRGSPLRDSVPCAFLQRTHHWGGSPQSKPKKKDPAGHHQLACKLPLARVCFRRHPQTVLEWRSFQPSLGLRRVFLPRHVFVSLAVTTGSAGGSSSLPPPRAAARTHGMRHLLRHCSFSRRHASCPPALPALPSPPDHDRSCIHPFASAFESSPRARHPPPTAACECALKALC